MEDKLNTKIKAMIDKQLELTPKGIRLEVQIEMLEEGIKLNFTRHKIGCEEE